MKIIPRYNFPPITLVKVQMPDNVFDKALRKQALSYSTSRKAKTVQPSQGCVAIIEAETRVAPTPFCSRPFCFFFNSPLPLSVHKTYELLLTNRCHFYDYVPLCKTPFGACLLQTFFAVLMKWSFVKAYRQGTERLLGTEASFQPIINKPRPKTTMKFCQHQ